MSKYEPLAEYLKGFRGDAWDATFEEIERVLGFRLPPSAHEHRAWWANQFKGHHSQAKAWIDVGWETREIDQRNRKVRFERMRRGGRRNKETVSHELWLRAEELSGISDRKQLEKAALTAFIQQEAGKRLVALGGKATNADAPVRRRFD